MNSTVEGGPEPYVTIGTQNWQRRNLDVSTYRNGDVIPYVKDNTTWANLTTGAWCWYNNDPELGKIYGKLYNWYAVNDSRGLAPEGWHIPSDAEWIVLTNTLGGSAVAGGALKQIGTSLWNSPNTGATNSTNFTALPGGYRTDISGVFAFLNSLGEWWSSNEINASSGKGYTLYSSNSSLSPGTIGKKYGLSVRCIKD